jgi:hypothetical protein
MGCGCGGGQRKAQAPKLPVSNIVTENVANLHPNVLHMQNIQKLAEERRKVERLKREQLLKALLRP